MGPLFHIGNMKKTKTKKPSTKKCTKPTRSIHEARIKIIPTTEYFETVPASDRIADKFDGSIESLAKNMTIGASVLFGNGHKNLKFVITRLA